MAALRSFAALAAVALVNHAHAWNIDLPPCVSPFKPFVYSGCFQDGSPNALQFRSNEDSANMTVELCMAECKGNGYRYAGLEYYGICFCGNTVNGLQTDEAQCTFPCNGNKSEVCGGNNILSVYQDTTFLPINTVDTSDYASLGCYYDESPLGKALSWPQDAINGDTMTTEKCLAACKTGGYPFAGTEFGGECWCGVVLANNTYATPATECDKPCKGNTSEICGGAGRLSLYVAKDLESLEPCGYTPPSVSSSSSTTYSTTSYTSTTPYESTSYTSSTSSTTTPYESTSSTSSTTTPYESTSSTPSTTTPYESTSSSPSSSSSSTTSTTTTTAVTTSSTSYTTPPTTTPPKSTTSTTSVCVSTTTIPSTCEYGCGKWCSNEIPDWKDQTGCQNSYSNCKLQIAACFKNAGYPGSMNCFEFAGWCGGIKDYCWTKPGSGYGKKDCLSKKPPKGGNPPTTTTVTVPCVPTAATSKPPTSSTTTTKCPIPTVTNICKQPSSWQYGYGSGNPVGGIELPVVTCNDLKSEFAQKPFKLYTESDSSKCGGYTRGQVPNACADACKAQYDQCVGTYAEGCRSSGGSSNWWDKWFGRHRQARSYFDFVNSPEKRTFAWADNYSGASNKCKAQYTDCLSENAGNYAWGKCSTYGSGW